MEYIFNFVKYLLLYLNNGNFYTCNKVCLAEAAFASSYTSKFLPNQSCGMVI